MVYSTEPPVSLYSIHKQNMMIRQRVHEVVGQQETYTLQADQTFKYPRQPEALFHETPLRNRT